MTTHVLIQYDAQARGLSRCDEYDTSEEAMRERFALEKSAPVDIATVVFSGPSLEAVERSASRYFHPTWWVEQEREKRSRFNYLRPQLPWRGVRLGWRWRYLLPICHCHDAETAREGLAFGWMWTGLLEWNYRDCTYPPCYAYAHRLLVYRETGDEI